MDSVSSTRRRNHLLEASGKGARRFLRGLVVLSLAMLAASVVAGPQLTSFVHTVGFSFDYPSKWELKRADEGSMLIPNKVTRDASGRPMELMIVGFVDTHGVTDPFEPSFVNAFERRYRSFVPTATRAGDLDWLESPMGTGLLVSYDDGRGNLHQVYCVAHGDLGIFLAHLIQGDVARPKANLARQIFSSFGWADSPIDPALVRSWTQEAGVAQPTELSEQRWTFATNGRLERAGLDRGGFYSSFNGVLNIVWDHGVEESYTYEVASGVDGGLRLELRDPDGAALRLR